MATPSSSAMSPSPPMAYLPAIPVSSQSPQPDRFDSDTRKKSVQKFLARAELSNVTRGLRTRLSYASYKATHNVSHSSLHDLELQSQAQSQSNQLSRTIAAKRKMPNANNNYYNNPATQGLGSFSAVGPTPVRKTGLSSMAPPAASTTRSHYLTPSGSGSSVIQFHDQSRPPNVSQSLFTSILAPPPAKQARTILNANDPPVPAPIRPAPSPRSGNAKVVKSIAEGTRAHAKTKTVKKPGSPDKRKGKRPDKKRSAVDADGDVDMKAAATLTSFMLNHRPSIAGSASSPRSSIDGTSDASAQSYAQYAQSSSRAMHGNNPVTSATASSSAGPSFRSITPPSGSKTPVQQTTPRPAPTDNEAADLMLFLATSPSPARSSNKDSKDMAAYRAFGGGGSSDLRAKGRVLFASASAPDMDDHASTALRAVSALQRGGDGSFTSSVSSIGSEMGPKRTAKPTTPSQLLPPPPLGAQQQASLGYRKIQAPSPRTHPGPAGEPEHPTAPSSPSRASGYGPKSNLGLRADVGRKLFQEEQLRLGSSFSTAGEEGQDQRNLGSGVGFVTS